MKPRILVVDDQYARLDALKNEFLRHVGCAIPACRYDFEFCSGQSDRRNSVDSVLAKVREGWPPTADRPFWALVLLDVHFDSDPPLDGDQTFGMRVLEALRGAPDTQSVPVVMLTEREDAQAKAGFAQARGFLPKRALQDDGVTALDLRVWRHAFLEDDRPEGQRLVGRSAALLEALREARVYALDQLGSVIIFGETGTGKTELARFIHHWSRREGSFIKWTAETKDAGVAKGELLGWWRGAHSQAEHSQGGEIEKAHQGTFFLDEVAYLTPDLQGLLMEVRRRDEMGMRTISRMGTLPSRDNKQETIKQAVESVFGELEVEQKKGQVLRTGRIKVDVLFASATNVDLWDEQERKKRQFRVDLLNDLGQRIVMPSLNQQREDIPLIFHELLSVGRKRQQASAARSTPLKLSEGVDDYLKALDWKDKNVVTLKAIAEASISRLGPDFDVVSVDLIRTVASSVGIDERESSSAVSARTPSVELESTISRPLKTDVTAQRRLDELIDELNALEIQPDQMSLEGVLPRLQEAYSRLVLRLLGAALRATKRSSGTSTLEAIRLLLSRATLRPSGRGDATKAFDIVRRLIFFADTTFERRGVTDCPILTDDDVVKQHIAEALKRGRDK